MQQAQLTELQDKLQKKLGLCLQRNNRAFILGGSKDIMMPIQKAFAEIEGPKLIIMITHKMTGKTQNQAYEGLLQDRENFQVVWFGVKDT